LLLKENQQEEAKKGNNERRLSSRGRLEPGGERLPGGGGSSCRMPRMLAKLQPAPASLARLPCCDDDGVSSPVEEEEEAGSQRFPPRRKSEVGRRRRCSCDRNQKTVQKHAIPKGCKIVPFLELFVDPTTLGLIVRTPTPPTMPSVERGGSRPMM